MRRQPKAPSRILAFYDGKVVDMSYIEDAGRRFSFAALRVSDNAGKGYVIDSGRVYAITPASRKALVLPAAQAALVLEQASAIAPHLFALSAAEETSPPATSRSWRSGERVDVWVAAEQRWAEAKILVDYGDGNVELRIVGALPIGWEREGRVHTEILQPYSAEHERAPSTTVLDRLLDRVRAGQREITFDTDGYTESQVQRVIATAQDRGLHASYDGRFVLVRDLGQTSSRTPARRSVRAERAVPVARESAHRRQLRMDTGAESFALTHPTAPSRPERVVRQPPVSDRQAVFDIDRSPRFPTRR